MGGPYGYYAKWDKSEKDKYEFTYVELKKKMLKDTENGLVIVGGEGFEGWAKWVRGVKKYKFPVINKAFGYYLQYGDNSQ